MFNFKKNAKLYIVEGSNRHSLEIYEDLSASQTFDEQSYRQKTLHNLNNLHDGATITRAAPANFTFTTPILDIATTPIILTLGTSYSNGTVPSFDMYVESDNVIYKIEKAVIDSSTFNVSRSEILTVSVSGSASKVSLFTSPIPGTPVSIGTKEYVKVAGLSISVNSQIQDTIASINIEVNNGVNWTPNTTLHKSLAGTIIYPESYVVEDRRVSGSITQFLTSENVTSLSDTTTNTPMILDVLSSVNQAVPFLRFNLPAVVYTRRLSMDQLFTRTYDFRLVSNSTTVKPIYKGV